MQFEFRSQNDNRSKLENIYNVICKKIYIAEKKFLQF